MGPVYQAGTLAGNPVAMAAGLKTIELISEPGFYEPIFAANEMLNKGLLELAKEAGIPMCTNYVGSMFGVFFTEEESITNYNQVMACDTERFNKFFHGMLENGVYLAPASYEAGFISHAHTSAVIDQTLTAAKNVFADLK
jgi:glutamate-1-semialdehyde 2,1-aminomutase